MNDTILLVLSVSEPGQNVGALASKFVVSATLATTIGEVKHSVWLNSSDHSLHPGALTIKYRGSTLDDSQTLGDIASQFTYDFELVINSELLAQFSTRQIHQFPVDIVLLRDNDEPLDLKLNLDSKVSDVKDAFLRDHYRKYQQFILRQRVAINYNGVPLDDDHKLARAFNIDVPPHSPVYLTATIAGSANITRFHINVRCQIDRVPRSNLIEVSKTTTMEELKRQIIELVDEKSVVRTYPEQVILSRGEHRVPNDSHSNQSTVYNALGLSDSIIGVSGIVDVDLEISKEFDNGVFNSNFVDEIRNRFARTEVTQQEAHQPSQNNGNKSILPIQPTRIVLQDGEEWNLIGESYERIIPKHDGVPIGENIQNVKKTELLVDQSDLAPILYDLVLKLGDEVISVTLNPSQCIIVDNPNHQPYLLLSPSGAAKLYNHFKLPSGESVIQQVEVLMYEERRQEDSASNNNRNAGNERNENVGNIAHNDANARPNRSFQQFLRDLYTQFGPLGNRILLFFLKFLVFINIINVNIPWQYWKFIAFYGLVLAILYCIFIGGVQIAEMVDELLPPPEENQDRPIHETIIVKVTSVFRFTSGSISSFFHSIIEFVIATGVRRPYDFEIILSKHQSNWWISLNDTISYAIKDSLLFVLTFSPTITEMIQKEIVVWKNEEMEVFERKIKLFEDLVNTLVGEYNERFVPSFVLPDVLSHDNISVVLGGDDADIEVKENRYRLMIEIYKEMEKSFDILNTSFVTNKPYGDGRVREVNVENAEHQTNTHDNAHDDHATNAEVENITTQLAGDSYTSAASASQITNRATGS